MLVMSRRPGESIHLGDDIVVTVVLVRGDEVRLGIRAPRGVSVYRPQVYDAGKSVKDNERGEK